MTSANREIGLSELYRQRIAQEAATVTARALGVSVAEIMSKTRAKAAIVYARQLAMYLAHVVGQLSLGQVSAEFGRERTTVGYSCHAIEDRRDSPIFDEQIERLETELRERLTTLLTQGVEQDECETGLMASG